VSAELEMMRRLGNALNAFTNVQDSIKEMLQEMHSYHMLI